MAPLSLVLGKGVSRLAKIGSGVVQVQIFRTLVLLDLNLIFQVRRDMTSVFSRRVLEYQNQTN